MTSARLVAATPAYVIAEVEHITDAMVFQDDLEQVPDTLVPFNGR